MEPEGSVLHSQEPATCFYPEADEASTWSPPPILHLEDPFQYYPSICAWVFQVVVFPPNLCMHLCSPYVTCSAHIILDLIIWIIFGEVHLKCSIHLSSGLHLRLSDSCLVHTPHSFRNGNVCVLYRGLHTSNIVHCFQCCVAIGVFFSHQICSVIFQLIYSCCWHFASWNSYSHIIPFVQQKSKHAHTWAWRVLTLGTHMYLSLSLSHQKCTLNASFVSHCRLRSDPLKLPLDFNIWPQYLWSIQ